MANRYQEALDALAFARSIIQPDWENGDGENPPIREWCKTVDALIAEAPVQPLHHREELDGLLDTLEQFALDASKGPWTLREDQYSGELHYMVVSAENFPLFDSVNRSPAADETRELADMKFASSANPETVLHLIRVIRKGSFGFSPEFCLVAHLYRQRAFSERTFGPGSRTAGVLAHIRKELEEIKEKPDDVSEWVDVILLALDGAWRAGFSPEQIAQAIGDKQTKNEARSWPDWKTLPPDAAIEHVRTEEADNV